MAFLIRVCVEDNRCGTIANGASPSAWNLIMKSYIGIGSNIGDRQKYISKALELLGSSVKKVSSVYETDPVDIEDGSKFLNAVTEIETDLEPVKLLEFLEDVEKKLGRTGKGESKSRTIDLDILLYGDIKINTPRLTIPHPKIADRKFVLEPLLEIFPDYVYNRNR